MKRLGVMAALASAAFTLTAFDAMGQAKRAAIAAERQPETKEPEENETLRKKRPGELVLYKIGSVECSVSATRRGFLFKADNRYGYDGRTVHEVEVDRRGGVLLNHNYLLDRSGKRAGEPMAVKYPIFYSQCLRHRVAIVGKREFPDAVMKAIGDKNWLELFTARAF